MPTLAAYGQLNLYSYCANNPVMYVDPTGELFGIDDLAFWGTMAIIALLAVSATAIAINYAPEIGQFFTDIGNEMGNAFTWLGGEIANWWADVWEPGTWPGDDPTVAPGDGFEWEGLGAPGSKFGDWINRATGDRLHPELGHPPPKGPHWNWRNRFKEWLRRKGVDIWPPGGVPPTPV